MQGILILATISTEKHTLVFYSTWRDKILTKSMEHEMKVKVPGCELAESAKNNCYARFHYPNYNEYRETHFSILLNVAA